MTASARPAGTVADEAGRAHRHAIYRLGFGVAGCMIVGDGLGWTLPFLAPILALTLLANTHRPPRLLQGFTVLLVIVIATIVVGAAANLLVENPVAFSLVISLLIFLTFVAHWRGAPPIVTLLTQLAMISVPLYSIVSPEAATVFSYLLWEAAFVAVLVVWIAFALFPTHGNQQAAPQRARMDRDAAVRRAAIDTLILLPMLIWHWTNVPENTSFYMLFVAILLLREQSETSRGQVANLHVRAALLGGLVGVAVSIVVLTNDTFLLFAVIVLATCLWFAAEVMKGGWHGAVMLMAFSTFLIVFGLGATEHVSATDYLTTRIGRLLFGILYVVAAMSLLRGVDRSDTRPSVADGKPAA